MLALRKPRLFILECIPRSDDYEEGDVLFKFLQMTDPKDIAIKVFTTKTEFIRYLGRRRNLARFDFVHLSGHGRGKRSVFELPQGKIRPDEFPEGCFQGKRVTLSACGLSRRDFIDPFMETTGADATIAPRRDLRFDDAAIWFLTFYYLMLRHRFTPAAAFDRVNDVLCNGRPRGRVKGSFEYWCQ
jgi:hypothetical protein